MTENKKSERLNRLCWFFTRNRLAVILFIIIGTLLFSYGAVRIKSGIVLQHMFPYDHPYLKLHARFSQIFGTGGSGVAIAVSAKNGDIFNLKTLDKIKRITEEIELWDDVYRARTVSIASRSVKVTKALKGGEISIEPLMWPELPETKLDMKQLKKNIYSSSNYSGILVSIDGTAALIFTELKEGISYEKAFSLFQGLIDKYQGDDVSIHISGFPQLMGWIYSFKPEMRKVFGISIALIVIVLFSIFRNFTGMLAPLIVGLISTAIGLGFVGWAGINFSPLLYVLTFLVGARKISHSVQVTHRYFEEMDEAGTDTDQACYNTMRAMIIPNVAGVVTDAAGFLVLLLAKILLMQQLAVIMSFWMLSIAFSAVLTPIICTYIPLSKASLRWSKERTRRDVLDIIAMACAKASIGAGRYVLGIGLIVLVVFCGWQANKLKIGDPTPGSPLLFSDHTYNKDQAFINKTFNASSENLMLFYEGEKASVYDPRVLTTFQSFALHLKEKLPDIYKSSDSIIDTVKMINLTLHDGDKVWDQLPQEMTLLTSLMGYIRKETDPSVLHRYMDENLERAQLTVFFSDHTSENLLRIRDAAYEFFKTHPIKFDRGEFKLAGGRIGLEIAVNEEMKAAHLKIEVMVLTTIFIMCVMCFRSIIAGLMLTIPLIVANLLAFAYMAMTNIGLSINTLPVAAVGVGVGVDFAIYLYSRCIEEYKGPNSWNDTVMMAVRTSGKAIVYTGITLVFAIIPWYFISELKFQAQMGFFLSMLLMANVVMALTLHPLLIYIIKPRFMQHGKRETHF